MLGKWDGFPINTGHSFLEQSFKWAGKDFRSNDDIDPVMMWTEDGKRVWNSSFGHAQVRYSAWIPKETWLTHIRCVR